MHRFFKLDGSNQGLPVCVFYADFLKKRFDWFKDSNGDYVQIAALIECTYIEEGTRLYVIGFNCTESGVKTTYPLPRIKYRMTIGKNILPYMSCNEIDSITEPVAVFPSSLESSSYFESNLHKRRNETFCVIPVGFIYRDNWDETENTQLILFRNNLLTNFNLRTYYNATENQKNKMFEQINDRIRSIGLNRGQVFEDEEIIEEVIEMIRYLD